MNHFERVKATFEKLPYMNHDQATFLRDLIVTHDARDILEIGFYKGKSSAYLAAILEDLGRGRLVTVDKHKAREHEPNIETVLSALNLSHRVTPIFADRSYTWEMGKMVRARPRPQFDICYFDAGHTWDATGFGFFLVDILLRPGGWIVFDDMKWTVEAAIKTREKIPKRWRALSDDERSTPAVRMVFDELVPHLGYTDMQGVLGGAWGIARKPVNRPDQTLRPPGLLQRMRRALLSS